MSEYVEDDAYLLVSFEGNISAGKTTTMERVRSGLEASGVPVVIAREPVDQWVDAKIPDENGEISENSKSLNTIGVQYGDPHTRSSVQADIYTTRVTVQREAILEAKEIYGRTGKRVVILSERSRISDFEVFAKIGRLNGDISDLGWVVYNRMRKANAMITPNVVVYVRIPNDNDDKSILEVRERLMQRAREGEVSQADNGKVECQIPLDYHKQVTTFHEKVFGPKGTHPCDFEFDGSVSTLEMDKLQKAVHYQPIVSYIMNVF